MELEEQFFREINSMAGRFAVIDEVMIALSSPNTWIAVGLAAFVIVSMKRSEWLMSVFFTAILALACADLTSFRIIKPLVARERPCRILDGVNMVLNHCGGSYGFTSNHAANAFAVWAVLATSFGLRSPWSLIGITLASAVAVSRVYLGVHFWGDVLGGAVLGVLITIILMRVGASRICAALSRKLVSHLPSSGK
jgi:undecaprenyl-diphosphatase